MSKILMVASEAAPFAKTGGLADVIGALPGALSARGEDVAVVLPAYREAAPFLVDATRVYTGLHLWVGGQAFIVDIRRVVRDNVQFLFVDAPPLYDRDGLYGANGVDHPDNHIRFAVLCHAALGVIRHVFRPDLIHCHDWQAALVAPLIRTEFALDPTFAGMKLLFTIHNLGYQGLFPATAVTDLGLDPALFTPAALEFYGMLNLMKGGIVYSDAISTVSRRYAEEIQLPEYGFGLDGLLRARRDVLFGIVNGVDYSEWSPETDKYIAVNYSREDLEKKQLCKADLLKSFGLPPTNLHVPLIGIVSRFAEQKGFDLIADIAPMLANEDIAMTIIGSGDARYETLFQSLALAHPDRIAVQVAYDNELAHKVEAGADMFLMPSRYEPCGLNQIYSLRYGTVPIVRATGGLDDTIEKETGFKFGEYSGRALWDAVQAALATFQTPTRWIAMMKRGMGKDFSWNASAAEYSALYRQLLG
jgi:starch synthase